MSCGLFSQMKMKIEIKLAGLPLRLRLEHAETAAYFEPYTLPDADADVDLYVTAEDFARDGGPLSDAPGAFQEYSLLVAAASRCLLRHGRVVSHGVAVKLGGRAWLITAPSGTGKNHAVQMAQNAVQGESIPHLRGQADPGAERGEGICPSFALAGKGTLPWRPGRRARGDRSVGTGTREYRVAAHSAGGGVPALPGVSVCPGDGGRGTGGRTHGRSDAAPAGLEAPESGGRGFGAAAV